HEVLLLPRPHVPRPDQPVRPLAPPRQPHPRRLRRPLLIAQGLPLQPEASPRLPREQGTVPYQVIRPAGAAAARPRGAAPERLGPLPDIGEVTIPQPLQETRLVAVALVKRQPVEGHAVGPGAIQLLQGDLPLGAIADVVGDAGGPAAVAVLVP